MKSQQFIYLKFKKLIYVWLGLVFSANLVIAQTTSVSEHTDMIGKVSRTGFKTSVAFSERKVADAWKNYLHTFGKVSKSKGSTFEVETAKIPAISPQPIRIMSKVVEESGTNAYVFCSFDVCSIYITPSDSRYPAAEKFLKDFAVKMYRDEYGEQINIAEKAFAGFQKNEEKLLQKDSDWAKEILDSEQDIIDLERKIQDKKAKIVELKAAIEGNIVTKRHAAEETETARKTVEQMKLKLGEIN